MKGGRFVAALGVHQHTPRGWTPEEVALVEETAERTWAALERARAEEALRESEEKYHMLFTSIDEAFALCKIVVDANGEPTDYLLLDVNPAFEEMTGITPEAAEGKTARELVPGIEEWWIETYGKVALGGETIRFENRVEEMDRWFDAYAAPVGEGDEGLFALVLKDITGRKREEEERGRMRSREAAMRAEAAERERISRELHDRVHTRWASSTRASSSKGPWPKRPRARQGEGRSRRGDHEKRPEPDPQPRHRAKALGRRGEFLETTVPDGEDAHFSFSGDESLVTHDVGVQIYMIMREAFANALKHSGCEGLEASLEIHPGRLVGTVRDDGDGFDADAATSDTSGDDHRSGLGLRSMRERAEMVGEELNLTSHPGDGTTMEIRVPLED